ncbi:MAG: rRNA maturation RNase YbeY [Blastocatellia bacterium]|nr:rRNA maturation RNase YbeY [Blastocatellia bacterium]
MIDVVNLQRKIKLDLDPIRTFVAELPDFVEESANGAFSVAFISDDRMRKLNHSFRGVDRTTDVLSFSMSDAFTHDPTSDFPAEITPEGVTHTALGDIVVSAEQAAKQAAENGLSLEAEIKQLILHGLLHLCGYDHETDNGEMNARELELRELLGIA